MQKNNNKNDAKAMGPTLKRAVEIIGHNEFTALYDKGYHTGTELKTAVDLGVNAIVSAPDLGSSSRAPNDAYNVQHFNYDKSNDPYTCPQGQSLGSNQTWYTNSNTRTRFQQYKTKACQSCKVKKQCTSAKNIFVKSFWARMSFIKNSSRVIGLYLKSSYNVLF